MTSATSVAAAGGATATTTGGGTETRQTTGAGGTGTGTATTRGTADITRRGCTTIRRARSGAAAGEAMTTMPGHRATSTAGAAGGTRTTTTVTTVGAAGRTGTSGHHGARTNTARARLNARAPTAAPRRLWFRRLQLHRLYTQRRTAVARPSERAGLRRQPERLPPPRPQTRRSSA